MEDFETQWLGNASQIKYVTWLSQNAFVPERNTYLPNRLLCTMDSSGKVLHVFDSKQNEALELLLYIALFICEDAAKENFSHPLQIRMDLKSKRCSRQGQDIIPTWAWSSFQI